VAAVVQRADGRLHDSDPTLARSGERRSWWSWKRFLNGHLDEVAYDIGAI
jgi:hypothetical protein